MHSSLGLSDETDWKKCPESASGKNLTAWLQKLTAEVTKNNFEPVVESIKNCFPAGAPRCYNDLLYYADQKINPASYNLSPTDDPKDLVLTSEKDLPKEFQAEDGFVKIPENILDIAKEKGWPNLLYKTRSTGGFDGSPNLFVLAVPSKDQDLIFQTSPHADPSNATANNPLPNPGNGNFTEALNIMTVIVIDKKKDPPVGEMRLLMRDSKGGTNYRWGGLADLKVCMECHTGPLRPLSPLGYKNVNAEMKMSDEQSKKVDTINMILEQYASWGKQNANGKEIHRGPSIDSQPYGWAPDDSFTRKEAFIKNCSTKITEIDYKGIGDYKVSFKQNNPPQINVQKLARAMNCIECHDNTTRGILHGDYSKNELKFKIAVDRSMPRNTELNTDERIALISCLQMEREALRAEWRKRGEWMSKASCFGKNQFIGKPPTVIGPAKQVESNSAEVTGVLK